MTTFTRSGLRKVAESRHVAVKSTSDRGCEARCAPRAAASVVPRKRARSNAFFGARGARRVDRRRSFGNFGAQSNWAFFLVNFDSSRGVGPARTPPRSQPSKSTAASREKRIGALRGRRGSSMGFPSVFNGIQASRAGVLPAARDVETGPRSSPPGANLSWYVDCTAWALPRVMAPMSVCARKSRRTAKEGK